MASFIPRKVFPSLDSLPRSYFLGHHRAGLNKMKTMLSTIDLVIECRDYRVPLTSRNPLFEENLAGRQRLIVYTKQDLGHDGKDWDIKVGWLDSLVRSHLNLRRKILTSWILTERSDYPTMASTVHCTFLGLQEPTLGTKDSELCS